jgi:hypothetical protein
VGGYNPYASPGFFQRQQEEEPLSDAGRSGVPWESQRTGSPLTDTVKEVLFQPAYAFSSMHRKGGIGSPLMFAVQASLLGNMVVIGYYLLVEIVLLAIAVLSNAIPEDKLGLLLIVFFVRILIMVATTAIVGTLAAIVGAFLHAALLHLALLVLQGARGGFEASFRLTCYAHGSLAVINIVPCVAPFIMLVMYFVVMIIGVRWTHEITLGKSVAAVAITVAVLLVIIVPMMLGCMFLFSLMMALVPRAFV